ncbi:MAG: methylamine utilization protein [Povalibacter sp.]
MPHSIKGIRSVQQAFRSLILVISALPLVCASALASEVSVTVRDRDGAPVKDVVVIARPLSGGDKSIDAISPAAMDQVNRQFAPFVIAVHTGTAVLFANSDSVAHQVYSFSAVRPFELGLYRGKPRSPILFDKPGVVVLGCNIHDNMVGYVYVTDAPRFGTTDASGRWARDLSAGEYAFEIWTPRQSGREQDQKKTATVSSSASASIDFQFHNGLSPAPAPVREQKLRDY